jgi:hypothetical protein
MKSLSQRGILKRTNSPTPSLPFIFTFGGLERGSRGRDGKNLQTSPFAKGGKRGIFYGPLFPPLKKGGWGDLSEGVFPISISGGNFFYSSIYQPINRSTSS